MKYDEYALCRYSNPQSWLVRSSYCILLSEVRKIISFDRCALTIWGWHAIQVVELLDKYP